MKFLVDECVGLTVVGWLRQQKYDVISVYDCAAGMDDESVLQKAFSDNRILITSDKDFGEMIFKKKKQHCGVVLLRLDDERPSNKIEVLAIVLKRYSAEVFGNFVVVTQKTIRVVRQNDS